MTEQQKADLRAVIAWSRTTEILTLTPPRSPRQERWQLGRRRPNLACQARRMGAQWGCHPGFLLGVPMASTAMAVIEGMPIQTLLVTGLEGVFTTPRPMQTRWPFEAMPCRRFAAHWPLFILTCGAPNKAFANQQLATADATPVRVSATWARHRRGRLTPKFTSASAEAARFLRPGGLGSRQPHSAPSEPARRIRRATGAGCYRMAAPSRPQPGMAHS